MKNKGFTLAELLGVIVIISIILLLVMIPITKNLQKGTSTIHDAQIKLIEMGTENWISDNLASLPQKNGESITLSTGTLKQEGYLDMNVKDPTTGECIPSNTEITITKTENGYEIYVDEDSGTDECPDVDTAAPIIYLNGEALVYVEYGSTWTDPGASAKTNKGVPITNISKVISGDGTSINTNGFNTYEITYSATDNGITVSVKRTVIIADTTPPKITVPTNTVIPSTQTSFNALDGVTATDNADGNLINKVKVIGSVSTGVLGEYILTYEVEDSSGNKTSVTRKVIVQDKTAPTASAMIQGNPYNSDGWAKANFQVKINTSDSGGSGVAGFKYCETTSTTCTPNTNVSKTYDYITIDTQSSTNYICVIPYDHAGNEGTRQCFGPYKLDKTKPTTTVTAASTQFNSSGWAKANISVSVSTTDTGSANVKSYTYCTSTTATCTPNTTKTGTSGTITIDTNGNTNYACAYSTDYAGNVSETKCAGPLKLDKNKPTASLTVNSNQFNSNSWAKANISASLTSSDTGTSNVYTYTYCVSTSANCTPDTAKTGTSGTLTMSSESSTNYVCAYVTDYAGNQSDKVCKGPYKLDKTKPSISYPASTSIKQSAGSYNLKTGVTVSDNLTASGSITLSATGNLNFATPGTYTINYTATDLAGNQSTSARTVTIYDDIKPSLSVSSSCGTNGNNGWCKSNYTVTLSPSDNSSGISAREYKKGSDSWTAFSGNSHTVTWDGEYTMYYRVKDGAGNYSDEKTVSIKKDSTAPTCSTSVSSGNAGENGWYKSAVTLLGTCSDSTSQCTGNATKTQSSQICGSDISPGTVYDKAGNSASCPTYYTKIDWTSPAITEVSKYSLSNGTTYYAVGFTVSDNCTDGATIATPYKYCYTNKGGSAQRCSTSTDWNDPNTWFWPGYIKVNGARREIQFGYSHVTGKAAFYAKDNAGNDVVSQTVDFSY